MGTILAFIIGAGFGAVGVTLWALREAKGRMKERGNNVKTHAKPVQKTAWACAGIG